MPQTVFPPAPGEQQTKPINKKGIFTSNNIGRAFSNKN